MQNFDQTTRIEMDMQEALMYLRETGFRVHTGCSSKTSDRIAEVGFESLRVFVSSLLNISLGSIFSNGLSLKPSSFFYFKLRFLKSR